MVWSFVFESLGARDSLGRWKGSFSENRQGSQTNNFNYSGTKALGKNPFFSAPCFLRLKEYDLRRKQREAEKLDEQRLGPEKLDD